MGRHNKKDIRSVILLASIVWSSRSRAREAGGSARVCAGQVVVPARGTALASGHGRRGNRRDNDGFAREGHNSDGSTREGHDSVRSSHEDVGLGREGRSSDRS